MILVGKMFLFAWQFLKPGFFPPTNCLIHYIYVHVARVYRSEIVSWHPVIVLANLSKIDGQVVSSRHVMHMKITLTLMIVQRNKTLQMVPKLCMDSMDPGRIL